MNRTQKLYELAHGLLYPDSGADCYPEEFRVRHAETLRLADELFALRGATPDEEGRLCLALLMGYMATIYDSGDKAQRRAAVLDRIVRVLPELEPSLLKCRLLVYAYGELFDERLAAEALALLRDREAAPAPLSSDERELLDALRDLMAY
ncbi:UpxZ family transcription anti-terminator antagonist [Alistipes sp.]|uniref:UpxZ family transcription anti-terminator antagonist n=1 Tax=Alistipes sp. TaxID=1872444 RepID=UPI0011DDF8DB|nr:UpxZ family transcription anti-terminator antagonist [Alistipes sp.]